MFQSTKQKILIAGFVILILLIPAGTFVISQRIKVAAPKEKSEVSKSVTQKIDSATNPLDDLRKQLEASSSSSTSNPSTDGSISQISFGPSLDLYISVQGRPTNDQSGKVFVGIAKGIPQDYPQYLLSFTIDFPVSGVFKNLSLTGLDIGTTYTAYLKGASQIATASAFVVSSRESALNAGTPLTMLSGDLNEDNVINSSDYAIAKGLYGTTSASSNWNPEADFNRDGIVNSADLIYINNNFGKIGASGPWQSTPPSSSPSASIPSNVGGPSSSSASGTPTTSPPGQKGYWIWMPTF